MIPFLRENTCLHEIDTERDIDTTFAEMSKIMNPHIIIIRNGPNSNELRNQIEEILPQPYREFADRGDLTHEEKEAASEKFRYHELQMQTLMFEENNRQTEIGKEYHETVTSTKGGLTMSISIKIIKKIIYNGVDEGEKYLLIAWPDQPEQAKEFEKQCATISNVIYAHEKGSHS